MRESQRQLFLHRCGELATASFWAVVALSCALLDAAPEARANSAADPGSPFWSSWSDGQAEVSNIRSSSDVIRLSRLNGFRTGANAVLFDAICASLSVVRIPAGQR